MKLQAYLEFAGISAEQFAETIGAHRAAVSRYINGKRIPDRKRMAKIAEHTGGMVTANDFFEVAA